MRTLLIIAIIVVLLVAAYMYIKKAIDGFGFDLGLSRVDLKALFSGGGTTNVDLTITITNNNNFSIPVDNLTVEIYYDSSILLPPSIIAYSTNPADNFVIPSKANGGSVTFSHNITINVGSSAVDILNNLLLGNPLVFTYTIKGKLFKFYPLNYSGTYTK